MSRGEVLDEETNRLLEDTPIGLGGEETSTLELLLDAATVAPTEERGVATKAVAPVQVANGEGGKGRRHDGGHPCQGLPILTMNRY